MPNIRPTMIRIPATRRRTTKPALQVQRTYRIQERKPIWSESLLIALLHERMAQRKRGIKRCCRPWSPETGWTIWAIFSTEDLILTNLASENQGRRRRIPGEFVYPGPGVVGIIRRLFGIISTSPGGTSISESPRGRRGADDSAWGCGLGLSGRLVRAGRGRRRSRSRSSPRSADSKRRGSLRVPGGSDIRGRPGFSRRPRLSRSPGCREGYPHRAA